MSGPRLGDRALFPSLEASAYLSHAAISPVSLPVRAAVVECLDDYSRKGVEAFGAWGDRREALRADVARLLGTTRENIGLSSNTSRCISDIAGSIPWRARDRVVCFRGEFPANVTPWQRAAELFELELVFHDTGDFTSGRGLMRLEDELHRGVRLVAVSAVQFQTGLRMPLPQMSELCRRHGAELFVDAIQSLGAVPCDVGECPVDYLCAGSHKWLMGVEGAAVLYVAPESASRLVPRTASWLSHEGALDMLFQGPGRLRYDRPFVPGVRVLEGGTQTAIGFAALGAAVSLLLQLGVDRIYDHVQRYHDALEPQVTSLGFRSLRGAPSQRSAILSFEASPELDVVALRRELFDRGVTCNVPDGKLRFAPHFPNSLSEVPIVVSVLKDVLTELARG